MKVKRQRWDEVHVLMAGSDEEFKNNKNTRNKTTPAGQIMEHP
jgi:hypothetical protein